ncbi:unnamed protein product [Prorocentrum cordatum]|uniref:Exonuclease domain-containing protein n=1 Tax=Prorocentrum cordatum TaxID=2364126 RepID=A0ABN9UG32_9DINO|nr:unnamed protein product [Polarella glacialis]
MRAARPAAAAEGGGHAGEECRRGLRPRAVALDCEMVGIGPRGKRSALAWVAVVDRRGRLLLDVHVRPDAEVTDWRTAITGLDASSFAPAAAAGELEQGSAAPGACGRRAGGRAVLGTEEAVRRTNSLLDGAVVVGHDLRHDFRLLRRFHHRRLLLRDTAFCPLLKAGLDGRSHAGPPSLRALVHAKCLGRAHCVVLLLVLALQILFKQQHVRTEMEQLRRQLHIAETTVPIKDLVSAMEWDRDPDGSIFLANTEPNVTIENIKNQLKSWMEEAGFEEQHWSVIGNTPGRRFKVQMSGDANAVMRKVKQAQRNLRQDGEWRQFSTPTIEGGQSRQEPMMVIYNMHNFGLDEATAQTLMRIIAAEAEIAAGNPHRSTVMPMGDFNFHEKAAMYIATPEIDKGLLDQMRHREGGEQWLGALAGLVELDPEQPTRYVADGERLSQLDKVFISTPGWLLLDWAMSATVLDRPEELLGRGISDHAEFSPFLQKQIEALLEMHAPSWKHIPVLPMAEYLGAWIGPAANNEMWARIFLEWVGVVNAITKQQMLQQAEVER